MIGPYSGGVMIDLFKSYSIALSVSSIALFIAALLMINPSRYSHFNFKKSL